MPGDGDWTVTAPDELREGQFDAVVMEGVPRWLASLDAYLAATGAVLVVGGIAVALPTVAVPIYAAPLVACALIVFVLSLRAAASGLAVSRTELRVRRLFVTVRVPWAEVDRFEVARGPHVFREKWAVLCVTRSSGRPVWVLGIRRPLEGDGAPFVDELTKASYRSIDKLADDLNWCRSVLAR